MNTLQTIILALVQGITEFLPISSSAHLILTSQILNWPDQGIAFDVAVHFGTLFAILIYFRKDLLPLLIGFFKTNDHSLLARGIVLATVPCALIGFLLHDFIASVLRSPSVIIATTLLFGLLLGLSDWFERTHHTKSELTLKSMLLIGISQILALIPGTSRSGITMTSGLFFGLSRSSASRFSFLLAIPIILLASGYEGLKLLHSPMPVNWQQLLLAMGISMVSAYTCIALFLKFIEKIGFWPFVVYRLLLGIYLLFWII